MSRLTRIEIPGLPHHVRHGAIEGRPIFTGTFERVLYLKLLRRYTRRHGVSVLSWCLMPDHVHLVVLPGDRHALSRTIGHTHGEFARVVSTWRNLDGAVWGSRFHSCPVEEEAAWSVMRYVELNPVRSGLVLEAEQWNWSSAQAHLKGTDEHALIVAGTWERYSPMPWSMALRPDQDDVQLNRGIREATKRGDWIRLQRTGRVSA